MRISHEKAARLRIRGLPLPVKLELYDDERLYGIALEQKRLLDRFDELDKKLIRLANGLQE